MCHSREGGNPLFSKKLFAGDSRLRGNDTEKNIEIC
jgi:hypothetical protein